MADEKNDPKAAFIKGARGFFKAAEGAVAGVKRDLSSRGGLAKTIDDGGKEILRAVSNVATTVGNELQDWGRRAQDALDAKEGNAGSDGSRVGDPGGHVPGGHVPEAHASSDWPKTREEYERKYGDVGADWPKTREEYERRYGRPAQPKEKPKGPTEDDPGFRIM